MTARITNCIRGKSREISFLIVRDNNYKKTSFVTAALINLRFSLGCMFPDRKFSKSHYGQLNEVLFRFDVNISDMYNVSHFLYALRLFIE